MSTKKFSELPDMGSLDGTEKITGLQGGANKNVTVAQVAAYVGASAGSTGSGKISVNSGMLSAGGTVLTNAAFAGKTINMISTRSSGNLYASDDFTQVSNVLTFTNGVISDTDTLIYFF